MPFRNNPVTWGDSGLQKWGWGRNVAQFSPNEIIDGNGFWGSQAKKN
jgi:hypothetical protein